MIRAIQKGLICGLVLAPLNGRAQGESGTCAWVLGELPSLMSYEVRGSRILTDQSGAMKDAYDLIRNDTFALIGVHSDVVYVDPKDGAFLGISMFVLDKANKTGLLTMTFTRGSTPPPIRGTCRPG